MTSVAALEKIAKFIPVVVTVAPIGRGRPGRTRTGCGSPVIGADSRQQAAAYFHSCQFRPLSHAPAATRCPRYLCKMRGESQRIAG